MLRDLAREAGMTPAKAHPYLASFSRIGLIEQDETTGRYEIGALALELGLISLRRLSPRSNSAKRGTAESGQLPRSRICGSMVHFTSFSLTSSSAYTCRCTATSWGRRSLHGSFT